MTPPNLPIPAQEQRTDQLSSRNGSNLSERVRSLRLSDNTQSGGQGSAKLPWILCGLLILVCAAFGYRAYRVAPAGSNTDQSADERSSTSTPSGATAASSGDLQLDAKGYVTPVHKIQVSPKISGQLVYLDAKFEEGATFKEGDLLARIEDVDYKTDYEHTKAMLVTAEKDLQVEEENLQQMKRTYERNASLVGTTATSQNDYDNSLYNYKAQEKRVTKLKAAIDVTKADLAKMRWRLDNTEIKAPITGIILTKMAEKYNLVNPSAFSNGLSASLCEMADLSDLEIDVAVQERDVAGIYKGQKGNIMPDAYQHDEEFLKRHPKGYEGVVSRLMPTADKNNGSIHVRVKVLNLPSDEVGVYLKPDMGANVLFKKKPEK
jgi:HlyD family secretion protein